MMSFHSSAFLHLETAKRAGNKTLGIVAAVGLTKLSVFVLTTNTEYKLKNALKRNNQFTS